MEWNKQKQGSQKNEHVSFLETFLKTLNIYTAIHCTLVIP